MNPAAILLYAAHCAAGRGSAAPLRVGSPAERNARARCSGPPCTTRWTTLRVQGPTLRDAALANGGHGSPPVAPQLLPQPRPRLAFHSGVNLRAAGRPRALSLSVSLAAAKENREGGARLPRHHRVSALPRSRAPPRAG